MVITQAKTCRRFDAACVQEAKDNRDTLPKYKYFSIL